MKRPDLLKVVGGYWQTEEPFEQKDGETQVGPLVTSHCALVCRTVCAEQVYVSRQEQDAYWYAEEPESVPFTQRRDWDIDEHTVPDGAARCE